jgi:hypothetical protein
MAQESNRLLNIVLKNNLEADMESYIPTSHGDRSPQLAQRFVSHLGDLLENCH